MTFHPLRARYVLLLIPVAVLLCLLFSRSPSSPLVIVSSNANFGISAKCTFGTNHVYYYGDSVDRILDPAIRRWSDTNAYRIRLYSDQPSTVIWVRLDHPDYAKPPPLVVTAIGPVRMPSGGQPQWRARLINGVGSETVLERKGSLQHYKGGYYVGGWLLPGSLEDHRGSVLHIESTNGMEVVTFRLP
jgi:hypothetical protein